MTQMTLFLNHESYFKKHIHTSGYVCKKQNNNIGLKKASFVSLGGVKEGCFGPCPLLLSRTSGSSNDRENERPHRLRVTSFDKSLWGKMLQLEFCHRFVTFEVENRLFLGSGTPPETTGNPALKPCSQPSHGAKIGPGASHVQ